MDEAPDRVQLEMAMAWTLLGGVAPADLVDARLQLHYAAQIVSAGAVTLLEPAADDSHPNLGWDDARGALAGRPLARSGACLALEAEAFRVALLDAEGREIACIALDGRSFDDALDEAARALEHAGIASLGSGLQRTPYDLPPHPVSSGAAFARPDSAALAELAAWLSGGFDALGACARARAGAADVRVWPHHFDAGSLFAVDEAADGSALTTVGFGLSLGDDSYVEPYWYVSPWPAPPVSVLPALGGPGHWHTEGFTAAVLTASEMSRDSGEAQRAGVEAFLARGIEASRQALAAVKPSADVMRRNHRRSER